jgi:lipoprotein NlpI
LAIAPNPKIFANLGEVMIQIGEVDAAHDAFRRGLILGNQEGFSK